MRERARAQIDALAERGRPIVLPAIEIGRPIEFPKAGIRPNLLTSEGPLVGSVSVPNGIALLCFIDRDRILAAIDAEITELADDRHALDPATRQERERAIEWQILETQRVEEGIIVEAAEAEGVQIARRDDADPRAVLNLASSLPAP